MGMSVKPNKNKIKYNRQFSKAMDEQSDNENDQSTKIKIITDKQ